MSDAMSDAYKDEDYFNRNRVHSLEDRIFELTRENEILKKEINRLKEGNLSEEEFQNLCHNLCKLKLTREQFEQGCRDYQDKLFGKKEK